MVFYTTIETNRFYPEIMNNAPKIEERVEAMEDIARFGRATIITAEKESWRKPAIWWNPTFAF